MRKKIAIFGATGKTGQVLVRNAIMHNFIPVCLIRENSKFKLPFDQAELIVGSPLNYNDVATTISGSDYVLVALNIRRRSNWPWSVVEQQEDLLDISLKNITNAMTILNVKRIISISAWGVGDSFWETNWISKFKITRTTIGNVIAAHEDQERVLRHSELNWTCLRPVRIVDKQTVNSIIVRQSNRRRLKRNVSRENLARFIFEILDDPDYFKTNPGISDSF